MYMPDSNARMSIVAAPSVLLLMNSLNCFFLQETRNFKYALSFIQLCPT